MYIISGVIKLLGYEVVRKLGEEDPKEFKGVLLKLIADDFVEEGEEEVDFS
jgi:hypothetical protein